jgi:hypothetical protein
VRFLQLDGQNTLPEGVTLLQGAYVRFGLSASLGAGPLTMTRGALAEFVGSPSIPNGLHFAAGDPETSFSSAFIRTTEGNTVTFTGPTTGIALLTNDGPGLLRLLGGGTFAGYMGHSQATPRKIELGGTWTTASHITGQGALYGNADIPLDFIIGSISAGPVGQVGTMRITMLNSGGPGGSGGGDDFVTVAVDVSGSTADRIIVSQNQTALGRNVLSLNVLSAPPLGQSFTIIQDDAATGAAIRPFVGLAEGAIASSGPYQFRVSYVGGDGNDVTLTVVPEPAALLLVTVGTTVLVTRRNRRSSGRRD